MCAINPKHTHTLVLKVYTSQDLGEAKFLELVRNRALEVEQFLNSDARLRWHLSEPTL